MSDKLTSISDASFAEEVLQAEQPVLVDYWAEWCGPCKAVAPLLEELAERYADRLKVVQLNIDDNPETPVQYNIRSIPTLMLFKQGNVEATAIGALSNADLEQFIDDNLG